MNLRSFQSALLTSSRIWNLNFNMNINPLDRHSLLETLFIAILHSTIQQKREGGHRFNCGETVVPAIFLFEESLDFARMFVRFKFVEDYVFDSELDCESAISTINFTSRMKSPNQEKEASIQFKRQKILAYG